MSPPSIKKLELFGKIDDIFLINISKTLKWQFLKLIENSVLPKEKVFFVIFQYGSAIYEWSSSLNRCPPKFSSFFKFSLNYIFENALDLLEAKELGDVVDDGLLDDDEGRGNLEGVAVCVQSI